LQGKIDDAPSAHHRSRRLFPEETAKYREIREQIRKELSELIVRHEERVLTPEQFQQLKAAREDSWPHPYS
jgi:hypothetical protein